MRSDQSGNAYKEWEMQEKERKNETGKKIPSDIIETREKTMLNRGHEKQKGNAKIAGGNGLSYMRISKHQKKITTKCLRCYLLIDGMNGCIGRRKCIKSHFSNVVYFARLMIIIFSALFHGSFCINMLIFT